jgi:hypothetical protein
MTTLRRRLRLWAVAWLVCQTALLVAFVPWDCCVAHKMTKVRAERSCHEPAPTAAACPMHGAANGAACPMHGDHAKHEKPTSSCSMRGTCQGPMAALLSLLSNYGPLSDPFDLVPDVRFVTAVSPLQEQLVVRLTPPESPPPRA